MPDRTPLMVSVDIQAYTDALAAFTPLKQALLLGFMRYMAINAAPLPFDLQACCGIVKARSMEARRSVEELTGLSTVDSLAVYGRQNLSTVDGLVYGRQGEAFEGSPEVGLTLRRDRSWGIDPVGAEAVAARARRVRMEKQQRYRARRLSTVDGAEGVDGRLVCARNSEEIQNTEIQAPTSLRSAGAVRAREEPEPCQPEADPLEAGRRRGAALAVLKATGLAGLNGGDPRFVALVADGVTDDELRWAAQRAIAQGKGFPYAVGALTSARQDAAKGTPASTLPGTPQARPISSWEAQCRAWAGPSAIGYKPP